MSLRDPGYTPASGGGLQCTRCGKFTSPETGAQMEDVWCIPYWNGIEFTRITCPTCQLLAVQS